MKQVATGLLLEFEKSSPDALVKYIVGDSKNFSEDLFERFSTRFAEDSPPKLERAEIRGQFVL